MDVRINSSILDSHLSIIQDTDLSIRAATCTCIIFVCTNRIFTNEHCLYFTMGCLGRLREEFRLKKFLLNHDQPEIFVAFQVRHIPTF